MPKHYLNKTKNLTKTCEEFDCSRISLKRWVNKYEKDKSIKRYSRKDLSYIYIIKCLFGSFKGVKCRLNPDIFYSYDYFITI